MYETFYKLRAEPFRLSPDHRFCYVHKGYAKARAYMAYAFMRAEGFVMITGRPGTGKTTLIGDLIESLARDNVTTANLVCTQLQADDLLKTVAYSFGVGTTGSDKAELLQRLNVLFHNWHRDGRRALLIVDEAQDLSANAMEELRLLTNIQVDGQPLLQIFLLGQPELRDLILSPPMEQVHQRIVAASHLEALASEETEEYIRHRLDAVGWRGDPAISKTIFPLIFKFSEGVPRRINLICSRLLLHGSVEQRHEIGVQDIRTVISELQSENLAAGTRLVEEDFELEDEFEEKVLIAESAVLNESKEVHLQTVINEPVKEPESDSSAIDSGPEMADLPFVTEIPRAKSAENLSIGLESTSYSVREAAQQGMSEPVRGNNAEPVALPEESQDGTTCSSSQAVIEPASENTSRKGGIVTTLLIMFLALSIIAAYFSLGKGGWAEWQDKSHKVWSSLRESISDNGSDMQLVDPPDETLQLYHGEDQAVPELGGCGSSNSHQFSISGSLNGKCDCDSVHTV